MHPRFYGSFPRVLGRYVREQKITDVGGGDPQDDGLPAATIGMVDRGLLALGMAADVVVFDPATIIDHATYENPALPSEGVRFVLVNGRRAERRLATNARGGRALLRATNMPSRSPIDVRSLSVKGTVDGKRVAMSLTQRAGAREASGRLRSNGGD